MQRAVFLGCLLRESQYNLYLVNRSSGKWAPFWILFRLPTPGHFWRARVIDNPSRQKHRSSSCYYRERPQDGSTFPAQLVTPAESLRESPAPGLSNRRGWLRKTLKGCGPLTLSPHLSPSRHIPPRGIKVPFSSVQFSPSVVSDSLRPHESQHARPPSPSPTPGAHPNPCPLLCQQRSI